MKKIFTLFSALLLTVSMWGADSNKYEMLSVSDFNAVSNESINGYTVTFKTKGYRSSTTYDYDVTLYLKNADDIEGVFSVGTAQDELLTTSTIIWTSDGTTRYPVTSSGYPTNLTISKVSGFPEKYQISGLWRAAKSTSSTSPYVYNFDTDKPTCYLPPYGLEPEQTTIDFSNASLELTSESDETPLQFSLTSGYYYSALIQFNVSEYAALPAGSYNVASSGEGTIMASAGFDANDMPAASYYEDYSDWTPLDYCITGGSLTIAYSEDQKTMTMSGTLTSAYGSTINVSASGSNPWFVPEPETIDLVVSKVEPTYYSSDGEWILALTATPNNFVIDFSAANLVDASISNIEAQYTYVDLGGYETSKMDATKTEVNALSIVATGNPEEYKLNATIVCQNKNTYVMKDVIFTYTAPTPWDAEPEYVESGIEFTATSLTKTFSNQKQRFSFQDNDYNRVVLEFKTPTDVAPTAGNHTIVNPDVASPANGDVLGSQGYISYTQYPSYYYNYDEYAYYYFRSGTVNVAYSDDNRTITMTGILTTAHGTEVTFTCTGDNPWGPKEVYVNVDNIVVSVTPVGLNFDIIGDANVPEIQLAVNGTQANPLALLGTYGYDKFDSWNLIYTKTSYTYMTTGSSVTISDEEGQIMLNATLIGQDGYTYYIEDAPITYSMAVSEAADPTAMLNRAMNATVDLTIQRAFVDGMWQTICLPFDIADIDASPLAGVTVKSVTSCSLEGETLLVEAADVTSMTAGMPYLIMWESGAPTNPVFESVTITTTEGMTSGNFVANMGAKTITNVTNKYMVVSGNGLAPMADEGTMKGFRAYFQINAPAGVVPRKFAFATSVVTDNEQVSKAVSLRKALVNGQLLIIKDNKVFNAQAQELKK